MLKERLAALGVICFSAGYLAAGWNLKMGTLVKPGPGLFPKVIAAGLLVCAVVYLARAFKKPAEKKTDSKPFTPGPAAPIAVTILIYPFLLNYLDFVLATSAALFPAMVALRFKNRAWALLLSLMLAVGCYLVFALLLGVTLPSGSIEEFLYRLKG